MIYINFLIKDISISSLFYLPKKEREIKMVLLKNVPCFIEKLFCLFFIQEKKSLSILLKRWFY